MDNRNYTDTEQIISIIDDELWHIQASSGDEGDGSMAYVDGKEDFMAAVKKRITNFMEGHPIEDIYSAVVDGLKRTKIKAVVRHQNDAFAPKIRETVTVIFSSGYKDSSIDTVKRIVRDNKFGDLDWCRISICAGSRGSEVIKETIINGGPKGYDPSQK